MTGSCFSTIKYLSIPRLGIAYFFATQHTSQVGK